MQSHTETTLREGIVWFFYRAAADQACNLGPQAPVAEVINKLELVYGPLAYFDILMQIFYKLQEVKTEKVMVYVT